MDEQTRELVTVLARDVVQRVAPQELVLFEPTSRAYFSAGRRPRRGHGQDEMLGFGLETAVVLLTPAVLEVCRRLLNAIADEAASSGATMAKEVFDLLKARLTKKQGREPCEFSQPQLQHVRSVTERAANDLRVPAEQIRLLADAIVGTLAVPSAAGTP